MKRFFYLWFLAGALCGVFSVVCSLQVVDKLIVKILKKEVDTKSEELADE